VHYSASKFAVIGLTQGLAKELAEHNINVNAVCLGVVRTPSPEDIANMVVFLSSDLASNMTGQGINVTVGMQLH
jgi:meso-butanediol dehydrogenase/(S,S)-butanediol dehydrogenase/diacetyl reductase